MTTTSPRALLYARLSVSRESSTSIDRQLLDLRVAAKREGWEIVEEFIDDGISGALARANATEALRMLRAGEADVLAVWKFDRWSRQGLGAVADLVDVLDAREATGDPALFVTLRDGLRSDQSAWRIVATVLAEVARQERENTSMRVADMVDKAKSAGQWIGGTLPMGYSSAPHPNGKGRALVVDPTEASILEDSARRIVGGQSIFSVVQWLNSGVLAPRRAARWSVQSLKTALTGDAIVGRQMHHGQLIRDADGMPRQFWPPAIPLDLWHGVRAAVTERHSTAPNVGSRSASRRSRLLSGLVACGECGARLYVRKNNRGTAIYSCSSRSNGRECPGVTVTAERLEEHVERVYLASAGRFHVLEPREVETPALALVDAEAALRDVSARLGDPNLDDAVAADLFAVQRRLSAKVRELRSASIAAPSVEFVETGEKVADAWAAGDLDFRRGLLSAALALVEVRKGRRGAHGLDLDRVSIHWTQGVEDFDAA